MIFCNIRTNFNFIFGQFSVAKKLILNGGAIRPIGLLFLCSLFSDGSADMGLYVLCSLFSDGSADMGLFVL